MSDKKPDDSDIRERLAVVEYKQDLVLTTVQELSDLLKEQNIELVTRLDSVEGWQDRLKGAVLTLPVIGALLTYVANEILK